MNAATSRDGKVGNGKVKNGKLGNGKVRDGKVLLLTGKVGDGKVRVDTASRPCMGGHDCVIPPMKFMIKGNADVE